MDLPSRPNAADVKDALDYVSTPPNGSPVARTLAAEVLHLRARVAALRTPPAGEVADVWLQGIIDDRPEGAYEGRDVYDHRGALLAMHELTALRARVAELENRYVELTTTYDRYVELTTTYDELTAEHAECEPTGTQWGVRWSSPDCGVTIHPSEAAARYYAPGRGELVSRTAPSPWRAAQ